MFETGQRRGWVRFGTAGIQRRKMATGAWALYEVSVRLQMVSMEQWWEETLRRRRRALHTTLGSAEERQLGRAANAYNVQDPRRGELKAVGRRRGKDLERFM